MVISVALSPDQQAWLDAHVARGEFASVEEAARQLLTERIAERAAVEDDDLSWAKPYVEAAVAQIERGEGRTLEEHEAAVNARLASLRG